MDTGRSVQLKVSRGAVAVSGPQPCSRASARSAAGVSRLERDVAGRNPEWVVGIVQRAESRLHCAPARRRRANCTWPNEVGRRVSKPVSWEYCTPRAPWHRVARVFSAAGFGPVARSGQAPRHAGTRAGGTRTAASAATQGCNSGLASAFVGRPSRMPAGRVRRARGWSCRVGGVGQPFLW